MEDAAAAAALVFTALTPKLTLDMQFLHPLPDHLEAKKRCKIAQAGGKVTGWGVGGLPAFVVAFAQLFFLRKLINVNIGQNWGRLGGAGALELTLDTLPSLSLEKNPCCKNQGTLPDPPALRFPTQAC